MRRVTQREEQSNKPKLFKKRFGMVTPYICKNNTRTEKVANKSSLDGVNANLFGTTEHQIISLCKAVGQDVVNKKHKC